MFQYKGFRTYQRDSVHVNCSPPSYDPCRACCRTEQHRVSRSMHELSIAPSSFGLRETSAHWWCQTRGEIPSHHERMMLWGSEISLDRLCPTAGDESDDWFHWHCKALARREQINRERNESQTPNSQHTKAKITFTEKKSSSIISISLMHSPIAFLENQYQRSRWNENETLHRCIDTTGMSCPLPNRPERGTWSNSHSLCENSEASLPKTINFSFSAVCECRCRFTTTAGISLLWQLRR